MIEEVGTGLLNAFGCFCPKVMSVTECGFTFWGEGRNFNFYCKVAAHVRTSYTETLRKVVDKML